MWNGSTTSVRNYSTAAGISFPALRQAGYLQGNPPSGYGIRYDNYVVVDADGIVRYTSVGEPYTPSFGRFNETNLRGAIQANLPQAIEDHSFGAVKALYR